jgi:hypothetical protein
VTTGTVGIGITNPTASMHVTGNTLFSDIDIYKQANVSVRRSTNTSFAIVSGGENYNSILYLGTPFYSGATAGAYKCAIMAVGSGSGWGWSTNDLHFCINNSTGQTPTDTNTSAFTATVADSRMVIKTGGQVGIGTVSPGYALHVVGAIYATGDITAFSDQRYKQNIIRLDRSLDKILQLGGYSYTREDYRSGERQIGLLAQEVKTVFPEAVSHDSINDKYSVNYNCLMAPVVESIKELYDRSEAQAKIISEQQAAIRDQQSVIQSLITRLGSQ